MNSNATMLLLLLPLLLPSSLPSPLPPPVLSLLSSGPLRCWGVCAARASAPRGRVRREGVCAARACAPRGPLHKKRAGPSEQQHRGRRASPVRTRCAAREYVPRGHLRREGVCATRGRRGRRGGNGSRSGGSNRSTPSLTAQSLCPLTSSMSVPAAREKLGAAARCCCC